MPIEPLAVASDGYLCASGITLSIVSNGYLCTVTVSPPIDPPVDPPNVDIGGGFGYYSPYFLASDKMWDKITGDTQNKVKLIRVTVMKNGIEYVQEQYTNDLTVEAKDVKFELTEEKTDIKIKIFFDK